MPKDLKRIVRTLWKSGRFQSKIDLIHFLIHNHFDKELSEGEREEIIQTVYYVLSHIRKTRRYTLNK